MSRRFLNIYDYIETHKAQRGYSPSADEIGAGLGLTRMQVLHAMHEMEKLGMLVQPRGMLQAIKLMPRQESWNSQVTYSFESKRAG